MALTTGSRLGPYEIVSPLGAGGMSLGRFAAASIVDFRLTI